MSEEQRIREVIDQAWENRSAVSPRSFAPDLRDALAVAMDLLDRGAVRVAEPGPSGWIVNEWLKKAVLLSFRSSDSDLVEGGFTRFYDKVPMKYANYRLDDFRSQAARIVPPAVVRRGAFIAADVVLMPSYVNIGAFIDAGSMIDTWATVGSCAQIGRNVHISGGAGIGGVLEPLQAAPTIIEDDCFIGARSEIVEGVIVGQGAVVSMGVFIGQSTKIYDRDKDEVIFGEVPAGAVVVPGSLPSEDGRYSLACAVIVKRVDAKTRAKTSINELLRNV